MEVRIENLKKHFGRTRAVDGISFSFSSGQIFAFIGPNGAGKTTTLRILATLDEPTEGNAWLDGVSVVEDPEKARRLIGFMPDGLPTHRDVTVREYLDFFARAYGLRGRRRRRLVESIEDFTNLTGIREKVLNALSKGMKQRVSLARALIHDPKVLALDEPAAGLDPRARIELRELLRILAERGKALLISSHILTELSEICDGTAIIEQGRLLRAGTLQTILKHDAPHRVVTVRSLDPSEELHRRLLEIPRVRVARPATDAVQIEVEGEEAACVEVLAELVRRGVRVVEFRPRQTSLEELFLNVTDGKVQ